MIFCITDKNKDMNKVDLLVIGNVIVKNSKRGGVKQPSYIAYANEEEYEADRIIQGDCVLDGDSGMLVAAVGGVTFIGEGV